MQSKNIFKKTVLLSSGQIAGQLCSLIRNMIYAHMLTPYDFGIISMITVTIAALAMATNLAIDKLLIQSKIGDDPRLQSTAHFFMLLRGVFISVALFVSAPFVADLISTKEAVHAFQLISLVPLMQGFSHLDVKRFQREMLFSPFVINEFIPQLITCLLVYPLVIEIDNYMSAVYLMLLHAIIYVLLSHLLSNRKYKISIDFYYLKQIFSFGWPLLFSGFLIFIVFQGDKLIIGSFYDMSTVGVYSAAFLMVSTPAVLIVKISNSIGLPLISRSQDNRELLMFYNLMNVKILFFISCLFIALFIMFGGELLALLFGDRYSGNATLVAIIGGLWGVRILRAPPTLYALAMGDTRTLLSSNIVRTTVLFLALYFAYSNYDVNMIALSGLLGEGLAICVCIYLVRVKHNVSIRVYAKSFLTLFLCLFIQFYYIKYFEINLENNILVYVVILLLSVLLLPIKLKNISLLS